MEAGCNTMTPQTEGTSRTVIRVLFYPPLQLRLLLSIVPPDCFTISHEALQVVSDTLIEPGLYFSSSTRLATFRLGFCLSLAIPLPSVLCCGSTRRAFCAPLSCGVVCCWLYV